MALAGRLPFHSDGGCRIKYRPVPPILNGLVQTALTACAGTEYVTDGPCPFCGAPLSGYDARPRRFAVVRDDSGEHRIDVIIRRSYCRNCKKIILPDTPFYPGTRAGSPVVDLCRSLHQKLTCGRVAFRIGQMGLVVDRWSVRSYCQPPYALPPVMNAFGMDLPVSIITLSSLAGSQTESGRISGEDVLAACYYPSRQNRLR